MTNYINDIAKVNKKERFSAIVDALEKNGIKYVIQQIPGYTESLGNIIVEYNHSSEPKTIISAHYDNVNGTPGANDNASACSIVLNAAIALKDTKEHLEFVFFDLEEKGFVGSRYYLSENKDKIRYAINMDMCGLGSNTLITNYNFELTEDIMLFYTQHDVRHINNIPPGDAYSFKDAGISILYIINSTDHDLMWYDEFAKNKYPRFVPDFAKTMHQPTDTIETVNLEQVEKIYQFVMDVINHF